MSERTDTVYLEDIIICIEAIEQYLSGIEAADFLSNQMLQDTVVRRFEIIGKAASRIMPEFNMNFPDIEWRLMSDMRNKLIHEYFGMEIDTVYDTARLSLPGLKSKLQAIRPQ
jgi:uncharacterized protein with HEPN domain